MDSAGRRGAQESATDVRRGELDAVDGELDASDAIVAAGGEKSIWFREYRGLEESRP